MQCDSVVEKANVFSSGWNEIFNRSTEALDNSEKTAAKLSLF